VSSSEENYIPLLLLRVFWYINKTLHLLHLRSCLLNRKAYSIVESAESELKMQ